MNAPVQASLLGVAEAPPPLELRMALVGQARRRAEVRVAANGEHGWLVVELLQPESSSHTRPPFTAALHAAGAEGVLALQAKAERIKPGSLVLCTCRGMEWDHSQHLLRAWRCDGISPIPPAEAAQFTPDAQLDRAITTEATS